MLLDDPEHTDRPEHPLVLDGAARDLVTFGSGSLVVASGAVVAAVSADGRLATIEHRETIGGRSTRFDGPESRDDDPASSLIGRPLAGGFRDAVRIAFPAEFSAGTPLALLLDDLPVASLISGYARLYQGAIPADAARQSMQSDICSGWRESGTMMLSVRAGAGVPVTVGPRAPSIADETEDDALGWHTIGALPVGAMRRRRLVDVRLADDEWEVFAMFRDTHVDQAGTETVLHEYTLTATVDAATAVFTACAAVPRVLPWPECPVAAASADRLVGVPATLVRERVRADLRGTSTCTHLNDLLRSLGDVASLAATAHATFG
ncbi:MAG: hypothetical protein RLZZ623_2244 [Actinomycetota bacterium]